MERCKSITVVTHAITDKNYIDTHIVTYEINEMTHVITLAIYEKCYEIITNDKRNGCNDITVMTYEMGVMTCSNSNDSITVMM